jgi:hypothetical protein
VTPFLDSSKVDAPANLSSPFPYPYIEVGMVVMLNKRGEEPTKRRATPALRKRTHSTVTNLINVTPTGKPLT